MDLSITSDCSRAVRTTSFKEEGSEGKLENSVSFNKFVLEKENLDSISLKGKAHEPVQTTKPALLIPEPVSILDPTATKIQKVFKSYKTRRKLADSAVVVEELRWKKALDFADPNQSPVSVFNFEKQQTAVSRWSRAKTNAANIGKGLSKDEKALKLALQHWLEAVDPRHRYGHNLHFYFDAWLRSEGTQPFFYWLDIGDGKAINLERCPRYDLVSQRIEYLGPEERKGYEVIVESGKLVYKQNGMPINTVRGSKWIFVLSTLGALYVGEKKKGCFHHSSFLAGGAAKAAGRLIACDGVLKAIVPYSGYYHPSEENYREFISFLKERHVDLSNVESWYHWAEPETVDGVGLSTTATSTDTDATNANGSIVANVEKLAFDMTKRLSRNWTSGVGPRIWCLRSYSAELRARAFEIMNLLPNTSGSTNVPIPTPRPNPKNRVSPRLACMGLPNPRVTVTTKLVNGSEYRIKAYPNPIG